MLITLTRTGGFTAIPQIKTIDTSTLPPEKAKEVEDLINQSDVLSSGIGQTHRPAPTDSKPDFAKATTGKPDRFTYNISIQHEAISKTIELHESSITPEFQNLIDYLKNC